MRLIIVSGLSGSGKSVALHTLEDEDFYCIDNLHLGLLTTFVQQLMTPGFKLFDNAAVGIDARSGDSNMEQFPTILQEIEASGLEVEVVFLEAQLDTLIKRFSETRRKHPLTRKGLPLVDAIHLEQSLLSVIASYADVRIDTTQTNVHQLRELVRKRISANPGSSLSLLLQSFGYKHGLPADSDYVFDVRCLPNPHWEPSLRSSTGRDRAVIDFLEKHAQVEEMFVMIRDFLALWIPRFKAENRSYLSVSIGCTGGQHRSVYLVDRLRKHFQPSEHTDIAIRHREL